jgi:hypothetical protein
MVRDLDPGVSRGYSCYFRMVMFTRCLCCCSVPGLVSLISWHEKKSKSTTSQKVELNSAVLCSG